MPSPKLTGSGKPESGPGAPSLQELLDQTPYAVPTSKMAKWVPLNHNTLVARSTELGTSDGHIYVYFICHMINKVYISILINTSRLNQRMRDDKNISKRIDKSHT
ncbi:unnamed protein product [Urochloa humidicola]